MFYFISLMGSTYVEMLWLNAVLIEEATAVIWMDVEITFSWCHKSHVPSASSGTSSQPLSSIRSGDRFKVLRDVFTGAVSSWEASRTFNKIACKDSGRKMIETPADAACHCGLPTSNFNA